MQDDRLAGAIATMLESEDELTLTVAELWQRVQSHHRQLEALEERLRHLPGPSPPTMESRPGYG